MLHPHTGPTGCAACSAAWGKPLLLPSALSLPAGPVQAASSARALFCGVCAGDGCTPATRLVSASAQFPAHRVCAESLPRACLLGCCPLPLFPCAVCVAPQRVGQRAVLLRCPTSNFKLKHANERGGVAPYIGSCPPPAASYQPRAALRVRVGRRRFPRQIRLIPWVWGHGASFNCCCSCAGRAPLCLLPPGAAHWIPATVLIAQPGMTLRATAAGEKHRDTFGRCETVLNRRSRDRS